MEKLEKCDESSVQDLESEKEELQNERNELSKRLADFEEKYNLMETNCMLITVLYLLMNPFSHLYTKKENTCR